MSEETNVEGAEKAVGRLMAFRRGLAAAAGNASEGGSVSAQALAEVLHEEFVAAMAIQQTAPFLRMLQTVSTVYLTSAWPMRVPLERSIQTLWAPRE